MPRWISAIVFCLAFTFTCSQSNKKPPARSIAPAELLREIEKLAQSPVMEAGLLGFSLYHVGQGKEIVGYNARKTLNVASCWKALITATALAKLGREYRFTTQLRATAAPQNGVIRGDVVIVGGGDPTLGSGLMPDQNLTLTLQQWVQTLRNKGIRQITGSIAVDERIFTGNITPAEWIWGDMGNYYGAPAAAINVLDNQYKLWLQPKGLGEIAPVLRTEPELPELRFINEVRTAEAGSGDQASIQGAPYNPLRWVNGTIPAGAAFSIKGALPDPAQYLATQLAKQLRQSGIAVGKMPVINRTELPANIESPYLLLSHQSPSLKAIIDFTNFYSVNLYAEAIIKLLGAKFGKKGSTLAGAQVVREYWADQGINLEGLYLYDGSGMARANGITAQQLTAIMAKVARSAQFSDFFTSLPVAGVSGTMRGVGLGSILQNKLHAKTGGMTRVLAYTGYFRNKRDELMAFTLISNNYTCKSSEIKLLLESIMIKMIEIE